MAAAFEARRKSKDNRKGRRREVVPAGEGADRVRTSGYLIHGGVIGLLLGAGAVLAAHFAGVLPNKKADENRALANGYLGDLQRVQSEATLTKVKMDELSAVAKQNTDEVARLNEQKAAADTEIKRRAAEAARARNDLAAGAEEGHGCRGRRADRPGRSDRGQEGGHGSRGRQARGGRTASPP